MAENNGMNVNQALRNLCALEPYYGIKDRASKDLGSTYHIPATSPDAETWYKAITVQMVR